MLRNMLYVCSINNEKDISDGYIYIAQDDFSKHLSVLLMYYMTACV